MASSETDTILGHAIKRAVLQVASEDIASGRRKASDKATIWDSLRAQAKAMPKASRVAAFVTLWGLALDELDADEITANEYAKWSAQPRSSAYLQLDVYRELFPDVDVNELGRVVRDRVRSQADRANRSPAKLVELSVAL